MIFAFPRFPRFRVESAILFLLVGFVISEAHAIHPLGGFAPPCATEADPQFCNLPVPAYPVPYATPHPTVPTYLTYGPFMPHNSLPNYRGTYLIPNANGAPGGTQVNWRSRKGLDALKRVHKAFEWAR